MVVNQLPFEVTIDPNGVSTDITAFVTSIDSCKFQTSGRIKTAAIMLEALEGAFITNTNSGATPQINEFEKIRIRWQDEAENIRSAIFEVDTELGQKTEGGTTLPLELKGRERALQDMKTTAYFEFLTPFSVINVLIIMYNTNKGADQPAITTAYPATNALRSVNNIYDFTSEFSYYDALHHVIERLNQPTSSGGVGNFFSLVFTDIAGDNLQMTVIVQGGFVGGTIISTDLDPTHSLTYRIDSKKGTQVFVRGTPNTGAVPNGFHDFNSIIEEVNHYPAYVNSGIYETGQKVLEGGVIYEASQSVPVSTPPPNATFWTITSFATIAGAIEYSEWTNNKSIVTKNSCANPTGAFNVGFDSPAFPDGNLVVRETFFFRDFVLIRAIDDTTISVDPVNKFYLRGQSQSGLYKGFRILVDTNLGNPDGSFGDGAGTIFSDRFGRSFENALVQWSGFEWVVIRVPQPPEAINRALDHVCVLSEGRVYEFNTPPGVGGKLKLAIRKSSVFRGGNPAGPFSWEDICDASDGNDVFHYPKSIASVTGLLTPEIRANQDISSYLTNSALKIVYEYSFSDIVSEGVERIGNFFSTAGDSIVDLFTNPIEDTVQPSAAELTAYSEIAFYNIGWWYALPFPYPLSEFNAISEKVGDLYGLGDDANQLNTTLFGALDIQNSTFSSGGNFGLNHDQVSDMGGPFTALAFYFNFNILLNDGDPQPFKGDIPFTITIYDDLSQVWRADYQYRHMGDSDEIQVPFSSFTVNRPSRNPWSIDTLLINLIHTPELEIRSIFQERRVRLITWQLKTSYDDDERYMPFNTDNFITALFSTTGNFTFEGTIDGLRLVKQPFVSSGVEPDRVINPPTIEATNTRNKRQLVAIAIAEEQRFRHKFESYTYVKDIQCDLSTEQSVFLEDQDMIKFADRNESSPGANDGDPNTRKLVVMEENFTFNAEGKVGGALLELTLGKRLPV